MTRPRLILLACYMAFIALGVCDTILGPTFESLSQRFAMPLDNAGIFTGVQFVSATAALLITGRLLDRINARFILAAGVLLIGIGTLLMSTATSLPAAFFAILLWGFGLGVLDVSPNVVVASLTPDNAAASLNLLNFFWGIGAIVGPQVVNFALGKGDFTLAYKVTGIFALALVIPFLNASVRVRSITQSEGKQQRVYLIILLPFIVMLLLYVGVEKGIGGWLFTQLTRVARSTEATATIAVSIFWAGLAVARVLAGIVLRRLTDTQFLMLATILIFIGAGLIVVAPTVESLSLVSAFVMGLGCGPIFPTALAIAARAHPESRGTATGIMMSLGTVGAAAIPWIQGRIGGGVNGGMIVIVVLGVIMIGVAWMIQRQTRAPAVAQA